MIRQQPMRQRGMTLIETAVGIALLSIIVISILSAFSAVTLAATRYSQLTTLDRLTRSDAEYIKSQAYQAKPAAYLNLTANGFNLSQQVLYYDPTTKTFLSTNAENGLQEIVLTVTGPNTISEQLDLLKVQP